jgi:DNA-binding response OmpR family regulator
VSWLRKKLGDDAANPRFITTVRGVGFRFERE